MPKQKKLKFIVSDKKRPKVVLKPGQQLEVVSVAMADAILKKAKPIGARLCGGTDTCLALVDTLFFQLKLTGKTKKEIENN